MELVYEATPRRLQISDNDDEDDEDVLYTAKGLQQDKQTLIKGSSPARGVSNVRAPSRLGVTLTLFLSFFGLGVTLSMLGPTLLDLSYNVGQSLKHVAVVFTTRSIGYVFGTVVSGFLFDKYDASFLLAVSLPLSAIGTIVAPLWTRVALLAVSTFTQGISMGFLDTGGNVMLLRIWGKDNGPYMQALHFSFALGALVAPLLAEPFISPVPVHNCTLLATPATTMPFLLPLTTSSPAVAATTAAGSQLPTLLSTTSVAAAAAAATRLFNASSSASTTAASNGSAAGNVTGLLAALSATTPVAGGRHHRAAAAVTTITSAATTAAAAVTGAECPLNPVEFTGRFKYAFFISGAPLILAGALFACFAWRKRDIRHVDTAADGASDKDSNEAAASEDDGDGNPRLTGCVRWQFLILLALFFLVYVGQEVGFASYIFAYGVRNPYLLMSSSDAALLTATFWGLFALGRFLAIPLAYCKTPPGLMMAGDLALALVAGIGLLVFEHSRKAVWLCSGLMGISLASVFPTGISWAEQYTEINNRAAMFFVVGAGIGEMIMPLSMGYLFEGVGPRSLMVASVVIISLGIALFVLLFVMARGRQALFGTLCCCCPGSREAGGRGSTSRDGGKRRNRRTRRQRNLNMEMAKQARPGEVRHAWRSSESDTV